MRKLPLIVALLLFALPACAATYYIDYVNGSDANNGTAKATPWAHLRGMQGCASNCLAHTPVGDDLFILRGCITWPNSAFPLNWSWSGTSGHPIYIGVDPTWYDATNCPFGWNRPIFDGQAAVIATRNIFIYAVSTSWQTWDGIEVKNFTWNGSCPYGSCGVGDWSGGNDGITVNSFYIHAWTHTGASNSTPTTCTGTCDDFMAFVGDTNSPYLNNSVIQNSIFDGSDGSSDSGEFAHGFPNFKNNVIHDASNAIIAVGHGEISNNRIYNIHTSFDLSAHENAIETVTANGTYYIHGNLIHDTRGECLMLGNASEVDYVWNNVIYQGATGQCNPFHFPQNGIAGTSMTFWNNVMVPVSGVQCFLQVAPPSPGWDAVTIQNNHCITTAALNNAITATTLTIDHNALMTPAQVTAAGYSYSETFAFSPLSANCSGQPNCPVGAGANLTASATGPLAGLLNDFSYACSQQTVSGVAQVVCPGRTANVRPGGATPWDKSAYQYVAAASAPRGGGGKMGRGRVNP